jgi:hypothetical protein
MLAPVAIGGALLAGVGILGYAGAVYASPPAATSAATASAHSALKVWVRSHRHAIRNAVVTDSAATIGVTRQDLVRELRSGKSIADVAGEHGVSVQNVVATLVDAADAQVRKAQSAHTLDSTQAAKIQATLPRRVTKLVDHAFNTSGS